MGCCSCNKASRWVISIVSICVIICCVVASVIVYKKEKDEDWSKLVKNNIPFIFILVAMSVAVVSSIIGFLLCCCDKRCLHITYLVIIVIVILVEIAAVILAFCYKDKIIDGIEENWMKPKFTETRRSIEKNNKCCGFKTEIPLDVCGFDPGDQPAVLCYDKIDKEIDDNMLGLQISVVVMTVVEIVLLVCASYLVCCDKEQVGNY